MRVLTLTRIFPSSANPGYAGYNRRQYGELAKLCEVRVWGLTQYLPLLDKLTGRPSVRVPPREHIDGMLVRHPRVLYAPKAGRPLSGPLFATSLARDIWLERGQVDLLVGIFAYPDGWAAVALSRLLGVPAVIHVMGSDVNLFMHDPLLRPHLRWAFRHAAAVVGPSQQLIDKAVSLGAPAATSKMIPNGIDQDAFTVRDRKQCRRELGYPDDDRRWILAVGRLQPAKGLWELLQAFETVQQTHPDSLLVLVGDGEDEQKCRDYVRDRNLPVLMPGLRSDVASWYGACDLFTLPSWREGTPNVVLEALACGRRVVASDVGGIPNVITDPLLGLLVPAQQAEPLAAALVEALDTPYDPAQIVARANLCSWADSAAELHQVFAGVCRQAAG